MDSFLQSALNAMQQGRGSGLPAASGRIYDDLRQRILSLELVPGTSLSRAELAKHYDVSQTPLRDALQRLEQDSLIKIYPQSKTLVTHIDHDRISQALFLRRALETEVCLMLATTPQPFLLAQLRAVIEAQRSVSADTAKLRQFQELDEYFHFLMFDALGRSDLHSLMRSRTSDLDRVRRLQTHSSGQLDLILQGHVEITDALESGDATRAVTALRLHLEKPDDWVLTYQKRFPDYFAA